MPDLTQDGSTPEEETADQTAAIPPMVDPEHFEDFEGFRETTLAYFTDPEANAAFRFVGSLLFTIVLEYCRYWPKEPEGTFRHRCRAAVADLRHLQGYLLLLSKEHEDGIPPHEAFISRQCSTHAAGLQEVADALERELGTWRGGEA